MKLSNIGVFVVVFCFCYLFGDYKEIGRMEHQVITTVSAQMLPNDENVITDLGSIKITNMIKRGTNVVEIWFRFDKWVVLAAVANETNSEAWIKLEYVGSDQNVMEAEQDWQNRAFGGINVDKPFIYHGKIVVETHVTTKGDWRVYTFFSDEKGATNPGMEIDLLHQE